MSSPRIKVEHGLWEHKWHCFGCSKTWFLSVDMDKERDRQRLQEFESNVSIHTMQNENHEVMHKGKEVKFSFRYK